MRKMMMLLLVSLLLVACTAPGAAPAGAPEGVTEEAVGTPEGVTEEVTEEMTGTPEMEATEEATGAPEMEATEEMTGTPEGETEEMTGTPEIEATEEMTDTSGAGGSATAGTVMLSQSADFGEILTDGEGRTLYLFTQDTEGASTCSGGCAEAWPAFTVDGEAIAGEGIDQSLLGAITRDDGATQVTYNGHPLYYYADDVNPGDTLGQGRGDAWYVLDAQGNQIQ
jgi:predicted lipoprotein with Yx(FWY)xxD motif